LDPYHGPNQANGLCFSVRKNVPTLPSLNNIYKELKTDIENFELSKHGTLIGWATKGLFNLKLNLSLIFKGVLLLNAYCTKSEANSHNDRGWETLRDSVVKVVNQNMSNVVFLM
jgi:uracil-DNA glycosylase